MLTPTEDGSVPETAQSWQWSGQDFHAQLMHAARSVETANSDQEITLASHVVGNDNSTSKKFTQDDESPQSSAPAPLLAPSNPKVEPQPEEVNSAIEASTEPNEYTAIKNNIRSASPPSESNFKSPDRAKMAETRSGRTPKPTLKARKPTPKERAAAKKRPAYEAISEDELAPLPRSKSARKTNGSAESTSPTPMVRPIPKSWQTPAVITSSRSPLTRIDVTALLQHDSAWTILSAEAQLRLLTMLGVQDPKMLQGGKYNNYAAGLFEEGEALRNDVMRFEDHLREGRLDPEWLAEAEEASEMREKGELDSEEEAEAVVT